MGNDMQTLYHSDDLVVTRQTDGSVFLVRPTGEPEMITINPSEWLQMLTIEIITNEQVQSLYETFKKEQR